jgi:hypothetical protein
MFPDDLEKFRAFQPPKKPDYVLLSGLDGLALFRRSVSSLLAPQDAKRKVFADSSLQAMGALSDLPSHGIFDRGRLVGLWEYDVESVSIASMTFVPRTKELLAAVTRTEAFVKDQLGDARSFSLDSPKSRAVRIEALRKAGSSASRGRASCQACRGGRSQERHLRDIDRERAFVHFHTSLNDVGTIVAHHVTEPRVGSREEGRLVEGCRILEGQELHRLPFPGLHGLGGHVPAHESHQPSRASSEIASGDERWPRHPAKSFDITLEERQRMAADEKAQSVHLLEQHVLFPVGVHALGKKRGLFEVP